MNKIKLFTVSVLETEWKWDRGRGRERLLESTFRTICLMFGREWKWNIDRGSDCLSKKYKSKINQTNEKC